MEFYATLQEDTSLPVDTRIKILDKLKKNGLTTRTAIQKTITEINENDDISEALKESLIG
jgi:hypothetical protein